MGFSLTKTFDDGATAVTDSTSNTTYILKPGVWEQVERLDEYDAQLFYVEAAVKAAAVAPDPNATNLDPNTTGASFGSESGSR